MTIWLARWGIDFATAKKDSINGSMVFASLIFVVQLSQMGYGEEGIDYC